MAFFPVLHRSLGLVAGLAASLALGACAPTPAPVSPPLADVVAKMMADRPAAWPETQAHLFATPEPGTGYWRVAWGDDAVLVRAATWAAHAAGLKAHPEQAVGTLHGWRQAIGEAPWSLESRLGTTTPTSPVLWVAPNCALCVSALESWPRAWPVHLVPVVPPGETAPPKFVQTWCPALDANDCTRLLRAQYDRARRMGLTQAPALSTADGRLLTGWPDSAWLEAWLYPSQRPTQPVPVPKDLSDI